MKRASASEKKTSKTTHFRKVNIIQMSILNRNTLNEYKFLKGKSEQRTILKRRHLKKDNSEKRHLKKDNSKKRKIRKRTILKRTLKKDNSEKGKLEKV